MSPTDRSGSCRYPSAGIRPLRGMLGRHECQKRIEIFAICGAQSRDIGFAPFIVGLKVEAARPLDRPMVIVVFQKYVRRNARVASVAVRKGMDLHQTVMKPRGGFQRWEHIILRPIARIVEMDTELHGCLKRINPDVLFGLAIAARPLPDITEQADMQFADEIIGEDIATPTTRNPAQTLLDIGLLQLVPFAAL